jgi:hypothetical protein
MVQMIFARRVVIEVFKADSSLIVKMGNGQLLSLPVVFMRSEYRFHHTGFVGNSLTGDIKCSTMIYRSTQKG